MNVLVPLANGFEEIEAITIIDVLRRASLNVITACLDENPVIGSHQISVQADRQLDEIKARDIDAIVLPGGMPGSSNLRSDERVLKLIRTVYDKEGYAAAICAAPIVLAKAGILSGKKATVFPGFEAELGDADIIAEPVVKDGNIITGKGAGCAVAFALKLVETFVNAETSVDLKSKLQVYWMGE